MNAVMKIPYFADHPDAFEEMLLHRARELDLMFNDAIADAINAYWIVLPPILARRYQQRKNDPWAVDEVVLERRVRVMRGMIEGTNRHPILTLAFTIDPLTQGLREPWTTYEPAYDEEKETA